MQSLGHDGPPHRVLRSREFGPPPGFCACCSEPAASSKLERSRAGRELIVPYCVRCLRHASAGTTRALAAALGSCLMAATLAFALPIAWPSAQLLVHLSLVGTAAVLPLLTRWVAPRPPPDHSSRERAVFWLANESLACKSPRFARALSEASPGSESVEAVVREPRFAPWLLAGPILATVLAPFLWYLHHPLVRVVNLTESRLLVKVDGRVVGSVEPTSFESPTAGAEVRMPSGEHELTAEGTAGTLDASRAHILMGQRHLYAPGSPGYCFWLEATHYGRAASAEPEVTPLAGQGRFWALPETVDTWFSPNPAPALADRRSSGGVLVALRQAPCAQAPAAVAR